MSAVTVAVLDDAWAAVQAERMHDTGWLAFTDYHALRGKAPWLVRVRHDLGRWRLDAGPTTHDLDVALAAVVRTQTLGLGGLGDKVRRYSRLLDIAPARARFGHWLHGLLR